MKSLFFSCFTERVWEWISNRTNVLKSMKLLIHIGIKVNITVTSKWPQWHLKAPASRSFTQPCVQVQIKKALLHCFCEGNSPVTGEFPVQWPQWRLKAPASRLFTQPFVQVQVKKTKLCVTGFCDGNSPVTAEFPVQRTSNAENVSIWWRHYGVE